MARLLLLLTMVIGLGRPVAAQEPEPARVPSLPVLYEDPASRLQDQPIDDVATWGPVALLAVVVMLGVYIGGHTLEYELWRWKWRRLQRARGVIRADAINALVAPIDQIALTFDTLPTAPWTPEVALRLRPQDVTAAPPLSEPHERPVVRS